MNLLAAAVSADMTWVFIWRIFLALLFGGAIGLERELTGHPAGLRTHVLVCVGSCLIMLVSMYGFVKLDDTFIKDIGGVFDPARLAAQVVSGIGFLGAGAIIRDKGGVRGLTSAATIWIVGMIGLACGNGFYLGALLCTIIAGAALSLLKLVERKIRKHTLSFEIVTDIERPLLKDVVAVCDRYNLLLSNITSQVISYGKRDAIKLSASFLRGSNQETVKTCLAQMDAELKPHYLKII